MDTSQKKEAKKRLDNLDNRLDSMSEKLKARLEEIESNELTKAV